MDADRRCWDERWNAGSDSDDRGTPTPPVILQAHPELLDAVPADGVGVDVACGLGAQALWMAERGLHVTALDVSPVAIDSVRARVRDAAASGGIHVDAVVWDTDDGLPAHLVDLALVVCQRYRATDLYDDFVERLRPGGCLVLTVLSAVGLAGEAGPFHAPPGELTDSFAGAVSDGVVDVLVDDEGDGQASVVLRRR